MTTPATYPLATLLEAAPEWMLDVMVDVSRPEVCGSHGFGLVHPRGPWLRLVVSDRIECTACYAPARWEDVYPEVVWCSRCADAEIALNAAHGALADWRKANAVPVPTDEMETTPIPFETSDEIAAAWRAARVEVRS